MIVADTDVLIDFLNGAGAADQVARTLRSGLLATTALSRFELLSGARSARQREVTAKLLAGLPTLPVDEAAADEAALVRTELERRGQGIGMADSLIAGIVRSRGESLLTRNTKHFERVESLELVTIEVDP